VCFATACCDSAEAADNYTWFTGCGVCFISPSFVVPVFLLLLCLCWVCLVIRLVLTPFSSWTGSERVVRRRIELALVPRCVDSPLFFFFCRESISFCSSRPLHFSFDLRLTISLFFSLLRIRIDIQAVLLEKLNSRRSTRTTTRTSSRCAFAKHSPIASGPAAARNLSLTLTTTMVCFVLFFCMLFCCFLVLPLHSRSDTLTAPHSVFANGTFLNSRLRHDG
jgi:hypothetical protein